MKRSLQKQAQRECRRELEAWLRMARLHPAVPRERTEEEQAVGLALAKCAVQHYNAAMLEMIRSISGKPLLAERL